MVNDPVHDLLIAKKRRVLVVDITLGADGGGEQAGVNELEDSEYDGEAAGVPRRCACEWDGTGIRSELKGQIRRGGA